MTPRRRLTSLAEAEGKSKKAALRCLKRHPARHFHHLLSMPAQTPQNHQPDSTDVVPVTNADGNAIIVSTAPALMPCTR
jgi:hypothetical protein